MENSNSNLLCQENFPIATSSRDNDDEFYSVTEENDDEDEYMKIMFDKEINGNGVVQFQESGGNAINNGNWIKEARLEAINYILNTQEKFGFKMQTTYLAITYFDTFLSRRPIEGESLWAIRILGVACLTLAAKMEEEIVPALPDFRAGDYYFDSISINNMELMILKALNWRMKIITPFTFIHYFVTKFCQNSLSIKSRVIQVILAATKDEKIMHIRPSVIAAGATLLIMDKTLTKETMELKINTLSIGACLQIEEVFTFYNELKEEMEKNKISNSEKSPLILPVQQQKRSKAMGTTSVSTTVSLKRTGLDFYGNDWKRRP